MVDMANAYNTDNVLVTWGYDFGFWDAKNTYGLLEDIMGYIRVHHSDIFEVKYSTVSGYLEAVRQELKSKEL